jgi:hypothetical protein
VVAVNILPCPEHNVVPPEAAIDIVGVTLVLTFNEIPFEVTGPEAHAALEVRTHVTVCPLVNVVVVNVLLLSPTMVAPTFH